MTADEHLVPATALLPPPYKVAYHAGLAAALGQLHHGAFWNHRLLLVWVLPSFAPEYALAIERKAQRYHLVVTRCRHSLWQAQQRGDAPPGTETASVPLGPDLAAAVGTAVDAALAGTRYPAAGAGLIRLDGTQYLFLGADGRSGRAHSPAAGTRMGELVELVEALEQAVAEPAAEAALLHRARMLTQRLTDAPTGAPAPAAASPNP